MPRDLAAAECDDGSEVLQLGFTGPSDITGVSQMRGSSSTSEK